MNPFAWQTVEGTYTRPFDALEKYEYHMSTMPLPPSATFTTTNQRAVIVGATLSPSVTVGIADIKSAWRRLRYAHPILECSIIPAGFSFTPRSPEEIDKWVDSTVTIIPANFQDIKEYKSKNNVKEISANPPRNADSAELYFSPSSNQLFLQLRHEIIDGVGSIMLLNNLLTLLLTPPPQEEIPQETPSLLPRSVTELTNAAPTDEALIQKNNLLVQNYFSKTPISLPLPQSLPNPYESHRFEYTFPASTSKSLLSRCKKEGISITHATTAAAALSILKSTGEEAGTFSTTFPVSLRHTLPHPYNTPKYAASFCITSPLPTIPLSKSTPLISLSKAVKKEYEDWRNDKDAIRYHEPQLQLFEHAIRAGKTPSNAASSTGATVVVSSLGIIENHLTTQGVDEFWIGQVQATTPKIVVFLYTFAGRIHLAASYNRHFHEDGFVEGFVRVVVETLGEGLDVAVTA
ncbi:hypothetical protein TWF481_009030 [Arthrobotrys musiformis]|uniref:Alcohol acetyltransferase n=1 Tax=Arthrobotrys musiformis TaxID=47236 RepID=A0AAV9W4A5_9PEZI